MKIISNLVMLMAALIAAPVTASYHKSSAYSEPDSSEPVSSEMSTNSASNYSAPAYSSASEEESFYGNEEKENDVEVEAEYESETQSAKFNEPEYLAAPPASSYTAAPVHYSGPAEVLVRSSTTMAVPIYRSPAVLPYWLRSQQPNRSSSVKKTATV